MRTVETIYSYNQHSSEHTTLLVRANGGEVQVLCSERQADDWILTDTFNEDGGYRLFVGRVDMKIVPIGGAEFYVDRRHDQ